MLLEPMIQKYVRCHRDVHSYTMCSPKGFLVATANCESLMDYTFNAGCRVNAKVVLYYALNVTSKGVLGFSPAYRASMTNASPHSSSYR